MSLVNVQTLSEGGMIIEKSYAKVPVLDMAA